MTREDTEKGRGLQSPVPRYETGRHKFDSWSEILSDQEALPWPMVADGVP